ncbi:hypothetical protein [uncultured Eudoraea sp.]|uniref:hypothetical protein n=1 Tax=uncultured Eudoraea sp. TaxID=1035614 RepID=UPI00260809B2|nr:hypothetical protein [uncultured Eudoraea sp.]
MRRTLSFYFWVLSLSGLFSPIAAQEQLPEENHDIPEPMVFDLVRELGARQGELEINVLAEFPLNNTSSRHIEWAPEIEYAIWDNFAVEFELPFEDGTLEALKAALQYTFGKSKSGNFIHGAQFMVEKIRKTDKWDLSLLYIPAYRFNETWSILAMLGLRQQVGSDSQNKTTTLLLNATIFAEISKRVTLGLEFNNSDPGNFDEEEELELLAMPQVHIEFSEHWSLQTGVGGEFTDSKVNATAAFRMIAEF